MDLLVDENVQTEWIQALDDGGHRRTLALPPQDEPNRYLSETGS